MAYYGSLGDIDVGAIDKSIADTAVDVFVYDTRKDSDGGAWRKRTQHTSWYNETLNTATRGSRREFPAVAVIVAETSKVTIYDGDDPDLPMWMVFNRSSNSNSTMLGSNIPSPVAVHMLNGILCVCLPSSGWGVSEIRFLSDSQRWMWGGYPYPDHGQRANSILERNIESGYYGPGAIGGGLINGYPNDVAMTVLPNAPIDPSTGLPVPTIAVATNGGVSVIKDDGQVFDLTFSGQNGNKVWKVTFDDKHQICMLLGYSNVWPYTSYIYHVPSSDISLSPVTDRVLNNSTYNFLSDAYGAQNTPSGDINAYIDSKYFGTDKGMSFLTPNKDDIGGQLICHINTEFNSGWMHGDIKGAFLSDTDDTDVTGTELITNGDFSNGLTGWSVTQTGSASVTVNGSNQVVVTSSNNTTDQGQIEQTVTLTRGKTYIYSFDIISGNIYNGGLCSNNRGVGNYQFVFKIDGTGTQSTTIWLTPPGWSGTFTADNFSLREAEVDRSVNGGVVASNHAGGSVKGLQVFGTITKTPVATGADLVAYSGFSDTNYLQQPYNSALDFGTGDFSITVWVKPGTTGNQQSIVNFLSEDSGGNAEDGFYLVHYNNATGNWYFGTFQDGGVQYTSLSLGSLTSTNKWYCLHVNKIGTTAYLYQDGELIGSGTVKPDITINSADISRTSLKIGRGNGTGLSFAGSMALLRISASAPSPEQIKKIYEDEKVLFQEGAQATLYGTSDAVTALAYDETTNLLHVGTSSGRSDFSGLKRINNTTTAVTTAISASNGLIAEQ